MEQPARSGNRQDYDRLPVLLARTLRRDIMNRSIGALMLAATFVIPLATPAAAQHDRGRGGGHGYRGGYHGGGYGGGGGAVVGGALLGLGVGALIGGAIVAAPPAYYPPPPVYYAPPPAYYAPPPPVYYGY
jgi:hypothetical protein